MSTETNEPTKNGKASLTKSKMKSHTKRLQIDLPEESFEKLDKIKKLNDFSSYTDMFKEMVRLYHYALTEEIAGTKFCVNRGGNISELAMFALKK
ncbi:hypothetical protein [Methylobacterium tardum]|uniref:Uncharacterized protein n=1 Tax=Methylobacterium tardum TaxID=374432 RepID=A0AA37WR51_9HYPH|nr:hypothetical protein [Methylobacterium tardum]URD38751.1 hypothetical protein M6G65_10215 [Methylobacterium tardum]GLS68727.1 hypothetical protein GCM10007890_07390 [Methylobacterium tardum]